MESSSDIVGYIETPTYPPYLPIVSGPSLTTTPTTTLFVHPCPRGALSTTVTVTTTTATAIIVTITISRSDLPLSFHPSPLHWGHERLRLYGL